MQLKRFLAVALLSMTIGVSGCAASNRVNEKQDDFIYQESVSPNEKYAKNQEDVVRYDIEIYKENEETISIQAKSNSEFFEPLSYEYYVNAPLNQEDISVEWTTLSGDPQETKENQLCVAKIKVNGNPDQIKINFANRAIELIEDALAH